MGADVGIVVATLGFVACVVGPVLILVGFFKKQLMATGKAVSALGVVALVAGIYWIADEPDAAARELGFESQEDMEAAKAAGAQDADSWAAMKQERIAAEERETRRKGFHCLSAWDGAHPGFRAAVKSAMRDPDSFEHIETRVTPVGDDGWHHISMKYRAKNGFGGMNVGTAIGRYENDGCQSVVLSLE